MAVGGPVDLRDHSAHGDVGLRVQPRDHLRLREVGARELQSEHELVRRDPADGGDLVLRLVLGGRPLLEQLDLGDLRLPLERDVLRDHVRALEVRGVGLDERPVVAVRQLLDRVQTLALHLLGEHEGLVAVHAREDHLHALGLHLRDLGREVGLRESDGEVVERDLRDLVLVERVHGALAAVD